MGALLKWLKQTVTWVWKPLGTVDFVAALPPHEVLARLRGTIRSERWNYLLGEKVPKSGPGRFVCEIDGRRVTVFAKPAYGTRYPNQLWLTAEVCDAPGGASRFVGCFQAQGHPRASSRIMVIWAPLLLVFAAGIVTVGLVTNEPLAVAFGVVAPLLLGLFALAGLADERTTAVRDRDEMLGLLNELYSPHLDRNAPAPPPQAPLDTAHRAKHAARTLGATISHSGQQTKA